MDSSTQSTGSSPDKGSSIHSYQELRGRTTEALALLQSKVTSVDSKCQWIENSDLSSRTALKLGECLTKFFLEAALDDEPFKIIRERIEEVSDINSKRDNDDTISEAARIGSCNLHWPDKSLDSVKKNDYYKEHLKSDLREASKAADTALNLLTQLEKATEDLRTTDKSTNLNAGFVGRLTQYLRGKLP